MIRTVALWALGTLVMVGAAASCSDAHKSSKPEDVKLVRSQLGLLSAQERVKVESAEWAREETQVAECMKSAGFRYVPVALSDTTSLEITSQDSRYSAEYIDAHAFGASESPPPLGELTSAVDENQQILGALSVSGQQAMMTTYSECEAKRGADSTAGAIVKEVFGKLDSDSAYVVAVAAWGACALSAGYAYSSYDAASADFQKQASDIGLGDPARLAELQRDEHTAAQALRACTITFGVARADVLSRLIDAKP